MVASMVETPSVESAEKHDRSDNFPSIDLKNAVSKGRLLYEQYKESYIPLRMASNLWGIKETSSGFKMAIAALRYYGLIEIAGQGKDRSIRVTKAMGRIAGNAPDAVDLIKAAALKPDLFRRVWTKHKGHLPTDLGATLKWDESIKLTDTAIPVFVRRFMDTLDYARFDDSDILKMFNPEKTEYIGGNGGGEDKHGIVENDKPKQVQATKNTDPSARPCEESGDGRRKEMTYSFQVQGTNCTLTLDVLPNQRAIRRITQWLELVKSTIEDELTALEAKGQTEQ